MILSLTFACNKNATKKTGEDISIVFKSSKGTPIAEVGNTVLTLEELSEDFLSRQGTFRGAPHLNTETKKIEYTKNAVHQRALFLEAIEEGLLNDVDVKRDIEKIVVQKLMRKMLNKAQDEYVATEEEMKEHYENNPNLYNRSEAVKVAYFAIPYQSNEKDAKKLAAELQKDAKETVKNANTKEFARLALKHAQKNMNSMKINFETNESSYLEKADFDNKFGKGSFELAKKMEKVGEVGPILSNGTNYFVIMKTGSRKALNESFADAKPKIQKRIAYEQRGKVYENFMNDIRKKYKINIHKDLVAKLGEEKLTDEKSTASAH